MKTKKKNKAKVKRTPAPKVYVIPEKTRSSKAIKSLKWKLKETRTPGTCCKMGCSKTGVKGIFCKRHKKILRKVQLKLNNIPWRAKVKKMGKKYVPDQPHVVYGGVATKFSAVKTKEAIKLVKQGGRVVESKAELLKAIAARKAARRAERKTAPKEKKMKAAREPSKPDRKAKRMERAEKVIAKVKAKKAKAQKVFDFS